MIHFSEYFGNTCTSHKIHQFLEKSNKQPSYILFVAIKQHIKYFQKLKNLS